MKTNTINRRHTDCPRNDILDFLQFAEERLVGLDDLFAEIVEHLTFASEAKLFLAPLNEERLELPFQRTDLLTDGGLGDAVDLG